MKAARQDDLVQEEILNEAVNLYRKYGPAKVTMDELAKATGRTRTSLYYYYKNREELFQGVLDAIVEDVIREIRLHVSHGVTVDDKLYAFCTGKMTTTRNWRNVFHTMSVTMNAEEKTKHSGIMEALHHKLIYKEGLIIKDILSEGISKKEIRFIPPAEQDMLGFILSSAIRGLRNEIYDRNDPHDMKGALRMLTDIITAWIGR